MFHKEADALQCRSENNNKEMFGRKLSASIAKDNGKGAQYLKRRDYPDKSRCYECGESGHVSYSCPKNLLGNRTPPRRKPKTKRKKETMRKMNLMKMQ
jgi:U11/U12 small nuclear ribonucleoprotein SNRNP31